MTVQDTLAERAKTYGDFRDIARISGDLQRTMRGSRNWDALPDTAREALQTIASKIARVLNGDPEHIDSWHDIAGYATLEADRLRADAAVLPSAAQALLASGGPLPQGAGNAFMREAAKRGCILQAHNCKAGDCPEHGIFPPQGDALPPDGYECEYNPVKPDDKAPWRARHKSKFWVRGATWREALVLAGAMADIPGG